MQDLLLAMGLIASFVVLMMAVAVYDKSLRSAQRKSTSDAEQVDDGDRPAIGDDEPDSS
jgi:hypothetical protein